MIGLLKGIEFNKLRNHERPDVQILARPARSSCNTCFQCIAKNQQLLHFIRVPVPRMAQQMCRCARRTHYERARNIRTGRTHNHAQAQLAACELSLAQSAEKNFRGRLLALTVVLLFVDGFAIVVFHLFEFPSLFPVQSIAGLTHSCFFPCHFRFSFLNSCRFSLSQRTVLNSVINSGLLMTLACVNTIFPGVGRIS